MTVSVLTHTFGLLAFAASFASAAQEILNVSYAPNREFYTEINASFIKQWNTQTGETLTVKQSHGGSGKQTRAIIDGLPADVATPALGRDVDAISV